MDTQVTGEGTSGSDARGRDGDPASQATVGHAPGHMERPRSIVFDCDSTLVTIEGITWLATDHREAIADLTEKAMSGALPLERVYGQRLAIVRPGRKRVAELAMAYQRALIPDARPVVQALHAAGIAVYIVSGGLRAAVTQLAASLGIVSERVRAVDVQFDAQGEYAGFDERSPLARSGGKREIIAQWQPPLERPVWLVGDGTTDAEARPVVDAFIAFAGIVEHGDVSARADVIVRARSLAPVLALALGDDAPQDAEAFQLYASGRRLLLAE